MEDRGKFLPCGSSCRCYPEVPSGAAAQARGSFFSPFQAGHQQHPTQPGPDSLGSLFPSPSQFQLLRWVLLREPPCGRRRECSRTNLKASLLQPQLLANPTACSLKREPSQQAGKRLLIAKPTVKPSGNFSHRLAAEGCLGSFRLQGAW